MDRGFEKIKYSQFCLDVDYDKEKYDDYKLPIRATKNSAGYDFFAINDIIIKPGEIVKVATGYKSFFRNNEVLLIIIRSSLGFKKRINICNQVGVIDSDYYNNINNDGHIFVPLVNLGNETVTIKKGEAYCQGIFVNFLTCSDSTAVKRDGGFGSTDGSD